MNPLLRDVLTPMQYDWVTTQSEYATDRVSKSRQHLAEFFPRLLEQSTRSVRRIGSRVACHSLESATILMSDDRCDQHRRRSCDFVSRAKPERPHSAGGRTTMAMSHEPEERGGVSLIRATRRGLELTCDHCNDTIVIPYRALKDRDHLTQFMESQAKSKKPRVSTNADSRTDVRPGAKRRRRRI